MLGRNASQPPGFHRTHCWHHVFWLHLFALYWRGRWISHYSEITVLWISFWNHCTLYYQWSIPKYPRSSIQFIVEDYEAEPHTRCKDIETAQLDTFSTRMISKRHSCSNVTSFFRQFFFYKINIQTTVSQRRFILAPGTGLSEKDYCPHVDFQPLPQLLRNKTFAVSISTWRHSPKVFQLFGGFFQSPDTPVYQEIFRLLHYNLPWYLFPEKIALRKWKITSNKYANDPIPVWSTHLGMYYCCAGT